MSRKGSPDPESTAATRRRYDRIAPFYDLMEVLPEQRYIPWRKRLWSMVTGPRVLEIGVGTGKNMPFYPAGLDITAIDLSPRMVERARVRAQKLKLEIELLVADAQNLEIPNSTIDTVVATCVFCSVPDPHLGLNEIERVLKPEGKAMFIEHVRSDAFLLGEFMDLINPIVVRIMGPNINRRTVENIHHSELSVELVEVLGLGDIFKLIVARKMP
jgi:ubiquinone/menaquinone biosynthesis C-methylase UbiE